METVGEDVIGHGAGKQLSSSCSRWFLSCLLFFLCSCAHPKCDLITRGGLRDGCGPSHHRCYRVPGPQMSKDIQQSARLKLLKLLSALSDGRSSQSNVGRLSLYLFLFPTSGLNLISGESWFYLPDTRWPVESAAFVSQLSDFQRAV